MFAHWYYDPQQSAYIATTEVCNKVPPGLYSHNVTAMGQPVMKAQEMKADQIDELKNGQQMSVLNEFEKFWSSGHHYEKLGMAHKRSLLLYGPPGCGKTGIIMSAVRRTIARDGFVFMLNCGNYRNFSGFLPLLRQVEGKRPILVVIEDIDQLCDYDEEDVLEILDGTTSPNGVMYLSTTNFLSKVPTRVRCRPSRIDTLINIGKPSRELREEYLHLILKRHLDEDHAAVRAASLAAVTEGFSLAQLKEVVVSVVAYGHSVDDAVKRVSSIEDVVDEDEEGKEAEQKNPPTATHTEKTSTASSGTSSDQALPVEEDEDDAIFLTEEYDDVLIDEEPTHLMTTRK